MADLVQSLTITRFGGPEVLKLTDEAPPPMRQDGVRIKVTASGVNFADLMMRMGMYPEAPKPPFVPGYEIAGVVTEIGTGVRGVHPGDRVLAGTHFGGYTSEIVLPEFQIRKIPGKLTDAEAAAIPVNFITAWVALHEMARVRKGDRVLIQSAAGGVGVAAVQMAAAVGAHVVGLVGSPEKAQVVKSLGAAETLSQKDWELLDDSDAGGFDIILDSIGGETLKTCFRRLAPSGRVVNFGVSSMVSGRKRSLMRVLGTLKETPFFTPFKLMFGNKGVFGLNMLKLSEIPGADQPGGILANTYDKVLGQFEEGRLRALVGKTFPLALGGEAHTYLQSRANVGKVVLTR